MVPKIAKICRFKGTSCFDRTLLPLPTATTDMELETRILIVEDHHATLDGLTLGLESQPGFKVVGF